MNWKNELVYARRSHTSNVILIETEDPKRVEEILNWIKSDAFSGEMKDVHRIKLQLDPWEGLIDLKNDTPYGREQSSDPFASMGAMGWTANDLKICDAELKQGSCVLVITGMNEPDVVKAIQRAVQNWVHHPQIRRENPEKSIVIIITSNFQLFDDYIRKHAVLIRPPPSTYEERRLLVEDVAETMSKALNVPISKIADGGIAKLVIASSGMTLHALETALSKSIFKHKLLKLEEITATKMQLMKQQGYEILYPQHGFEAVGGYEILKDYIRTHIIGVLTNDTARKWGVKASRGILMFGLGGTGKTIFAKAIAKEMNLPFIKVSSADIFRGIVGGSEAQVINLQRVAEDNAPCIVFIDEIDQLGLRRDAVMSTDSGASRRVQNLLMDWLGDETRESIVIGATNVVEQMDPAFIRQGRWGQIIPTFLPDENAREEIFRVHTSVVRSIPLASDVDFKVLAKRTFLWSGAEIEALVVESATYALTRGARAVEMADFEQGFQEITINTERRADELKNFIYIAKQYSTSKRLLEAQLSSFVKKERQVSKLEAVLKELEA